MKFTRRQWKREQLQAAQAVENSTPQTPTPLDPPLNETPQACPKAGACGGQNKRCKNDNSQNVDTDNTSTTSEEIPSSWYEMKAKLLQQQKERKQAKTESLESASVNPMKDYWDKLFGR
jgi:hypothetical protein